MSIKRTIITTIVALALVAVVAPGVTQATTISDLMAQIAALQAQLQSLSGSTTTTTTSGNLPSSCSGVTFTRNLTVGATGSDVKCLQALLNLSTATQVSATGAGAPGNETTYFGPKTLVAVKAYQVGKGFTPANQVGPMTRQALNAQLGGSSSTTTTTTTTTGTTQTGTISATLAADNPPSGAIVGGQAQADLLHINFTGTGTVTSVTLQRTGISDSNLFSAIYLYDGNTRITSGYSFSSTSVLTMNGLSIPVNGSHIISVRGDVSSTGGCTSTIVTGCQSSASVALTGFMGNGASASTNVSGNVMSVVSGTLATASFSSDTTVASPLSATINAGSVNQTLWSRTISISPRAVMLYGVIVKMIGSAPANTLANVGLYIDGTQVETASINSYNQYVFSSSNPSTISTGSHLLEIRGDIVAGSSRNFYLSLEQGSDISLRDSQLGVFITPTFNSASVANVNGGTITVNGVNGGSITIAQDPNFSGITTLVGGASNVKMASFKFTGYGEDEKVTTLSFTPTISGTGTTLRNVGLYVNGVQVGSNQTATTAQTLTFSNLGSNLTVPAGSSVTVSIMGDVITPGGVNYTTGAAKFDLIGGSSNAQGVSSGMFASTSSATGQSLTISSASAVNTFATTTGFAVTSPAPNAIVKIGSWTLQTGSAEGLTVKNISVALAGTLVSNNQITNLTVQNGTTVIGQVVGTPTTTNNYSVIIPLAINTPLTLDVYAQMGSSSNGYNVTPTMTLTYSGAISTLSTTTSGVPGSQTTVAVPAIAAGGITYDTNSLTPQFVTGNSGIIGVPSNADIKFGNFLVVSSNTVGGALLKDLTFTTTTNTILSVTVWNSTGTTAVGSATVSNNQAVVRGVNLTVPAGTNTLTIPVTAKMVCIGQGCAGTASATANMALSTVTYYDGTTTPSVTPSLATSNNLYLVSTVPSVTLTPGSSTGLVGGGATQKIGTFTVSAGTTGDIKIVAIPIVVNPSTVTIGAGSVELRAADGSVLTNAPAALDGGSHTFDLSAHPITVAQNNPTTFTVYATVNGATGAAGTSSVSFGLGARGSFLWKDVSGNSGNITGTYINSYITDSQSKTN
jgi:hypothetical protein